MSHEEAVTIPEAGEDGWRSCQRCGALVRDDALEGHRQRRCIIRHPDPPLPEGG